MHYAVDYKLGYRPYTRPDKCRRRFKCKLRLYYL